MSEKEEYIQYTCRKCGGKSEPQLRRLASSGGIAHTDECLITWMRREEDLAAGRITLEDIENERKAKAEAKAKAQFARYQSFVAKHGIVSAHSGYQECVGCGSFGYFPDDSLSRHEPNCIVAEARAAVAKESGGG